MAPSKSLGLGVVVCAVLAGSIVAAVRLGPLRASAADYESARVLGMTSAAWQASHNRFYRFLDSIFVEDSSGVLRPLESFVALKKNLTRVKQESEEQHRVALALRKRVDALEPPPGLRKLHELLVSHLEWDATRSRDVGFAATKSIAEERWSPFDDAVNAYYWVLPEGAALLRDSRLEGAVTWDSSIAEVALPLDKDGEIQSKPNYWSFLWTFVGGLLVLYIPVAILVGVASFLRDEGAYKSGLSRSATLVASNALVAVLAVSIGCYACGIAQEVASSTFGGSWAFAVPPMLLAISLVALIRYGNDGGDYGQWGPLLPTLAFATGYLLPLLVDTHSSVGQVCMRLFTFGTGM